MDDSIPQEAEFPTSSSLCGLLLPLLSCLVRNPPLLGNSPLVEEAVSLHPSLLTFCPLRIARHSCLFCFQYRVEEELSCPPPGNLPIPDIKSWSPTLQVDSLPSEPPGKPKSTGVVCRALLQGIFPTQGLNPHLLFPALAGGFLVFFFFYH